MLLGFVFIGFSIWVFFLARFFALAHRFDVYLMRHYPEKAKEWWSRYPALKWWKLAPVPYWHISLWETDIPDDRSLKDLKRKATYAFLGSFVTIPVIVALLVVFSAGSSEAGQSM
jgi:hypothetical protein